MKKRASQHCTATRGPPDALQLDAPNTPCSLISQNPTSTPCQHLAIELLITSTDFLDLPERPDLVAFIGGGFIAMEFAHIAKRAGASEVTVLEMMERPLGNFDPDLVAILVEATAELGVALRTEAKVLKVEKQGDDLAVSFETSGGIKVVTCDTVVHATGRVPNIDELNLAAAGVEHGPRGIKVNASMRTTNPNIFAAGDCADSGPNLTPVSAYEGRIAAKNLLVSLRRAQRVLPADPERRLHPAHARDRRTVGDGCAGEGAEVRHPLREDTGLVLLAAGRGEMDGLQGSCRTGDRPIPGAHLMGPGAEEQINLFAMAMGAGLTANQIKAMIFAYPSYASDIGSMV